MTAIALFASTFALVFLLGVQQLNVQHGHQVAAFFTSLFIGCSQLALYKMAPDAGGIEIACYLAGGPLAIICAMKVHPWLRKNWGRS
jgi:hypothetical protein